jgi:hypothetical protein
LKTILSLTIRDFCRGLYIYTFGLITEAVPYSRGLYRSSIL